MPGFTEIMGFMPLAAPLIAGNDRARDVNLKWPRCDGADWLRDFAGRCYPCRNWGAHGGIKQDCSPFASVSVSSRSTL